MNKKIDLKKEFKQLYNPSSKEPVIINVPEFQFLMIEGQGSTDTESFQDAVKALFGVSYKTKFKIKKEKNIDYAVMPLEGLWWADDMNDFINFNKSNWRWILMIMQPEFITSDIIMSTIDIIEKKEPNNDLNKLKLAKFTEGNSAQIMHIGPYSTEGPNIQRLHQKIAEIGGQLSGKHHEIYLSDPRRISPDKMKTVLRQPYCL